MLAMIIWHNFGLCEFSLRGKSLSPEDEGCLFHSTKIKIQGGQADKYISHPPLKESLKDKKLVAMWASREYGNIISMGNSLGIRSWGWGERGESIESYGQERS